MEHPTSHLRGKQRGVRGSSVARQKACLDEIERDTKEFLYSPEEPDISVVEEWHALEKNDKKQLRQKGVSWLTLSGEKMAGEGEKAADAVFIFANCRLVVFVTEVSGRGKRFVDALEQVRSTVDKLKEKGLLGQDDDFVPVVVGASGKRPSRDRLKICGKPVFCRSHSQTIGKRVRELFEV